MVKQLNHLKKYDETIHFYEILVIISNVMKYWKIKSNYSIFENIIVGNKHYGLQKSF